MNLNNRDSFLFLSKGRKGGKENNPADYFPDAARDSSMAHNLKVLIYLVKRNLLDIFYSLIYQNS